MKIQEVKMATFFNQASLSFNGNVVNSNVTEAELLVGLEITKTPITATYTAGGNIVYAVAVRNAGGTAYDSLTLVDDLGTYTLPGGGSATPLTYVADSLVYYLDGVLQPTPTVITGIGLTVDGIDLPGGSTALFIYEAQANEFAPIAAGSSITNTASTDGGVGVGEISASATVTVREAPSLTIAKAVCPAIVNDNDLITYTVIVQNLGNVAVVATDGVVISDVFNPILSDLTVTLDGETLAEGTGYTYNELTGEFATVNGAITVPAATYTVDPESGIITTTPGVTVLTVTGRI